MAALEVPCPQFAVAVKRPIKVAIITIIRAFGDC